jgi:hypothetical protein
VVLRLATIESIEKKLYTAEAVSYGSDANVDVGLEVDRRQSSTYFWPGDGALSLRRARDELPLAGRRAEARGSTSGLSVPEGLPHDVWDRRAWFFVSYRSALHRRHGRLVPGHRLVAAGCTAYRRRPPAHSLARLILLAATPRAPHCGNLPGAIQVLPYALAADCM